MKLLNTIHVTVFAKEQEDFDAIKNALLKLIPFNLEKEKIELKIINASGFEKTIRILEVALSKEKHTNAFLKEFTQKLSSEQKKTLIEQFDSRCDAEFNYFIRVEKDALLDGKFELTDSGNCFHIKMNIACYPKNLKSAKSIVEKMLG